MPVGYFHTGTPAANDSGPSTARSRKDPPRNRKNVSGPVVAGATGPIARTIIVRFYFNCEKLNTSDAVVSVTRLRLSGAEMHRTGDRFSEPRSKYARASAQTAIPQWCNKRHHPHQGDYQFLVDFPTQKEAPSRVLLLGFRR
jgi:hypothetical protein